MSSAPQPSSSAASGSTPPPHAPTTAATPLPAEEDEALSRMFARMDAHSANTGASSSSGGPLAAAPAAARAAADDDAGDDDDDGGSDVDEVWQDAQEDHESEGGDGEEWSTSRLEAGLDKADDLKQRANAEFSPGKAFHQALTTYFSALACLPAHAPSAADKCKQKALGGADDDDGVRIEEVDDDEAALIERGQTDEEKQRERLDERCRTLRAVLWANMAAVYLKLDQNKEAVEACTEALKDDPTHVKALLRRSTANTTIGTWSSLTSAEDDLKTLLPLLPPTSPLRAHAERELRALPRRIQERAEAEKGEMLGKLNDLGNSLLGNFGLSTDNFKFEPNGQGGYAINFVR